jgi:hypothetical protein
MSSRATFREDFIIFQVLETAIPQEYLLNNLNYMELL